MQFVIVRKTKKIFLLITLLFSVLINFSKQDLPVHCLKSQILGKWIISASDLIPVDNGYEMKCGHDLPSREDNSYLATSPYELKNHYEVDLREIDFAELSLDSNEKYVGRWTMVYDEGFNIDFENLSFFAFSKYFIDKSNPSKTQFNSMCYSTCVGWYHNKDKTKWGCYSAKKLGVNANEVTAKDTKNNVSILEPTNNLENNIINSMLNMQFKSIGSQITFSNPLDNNKTTGDNLDNNLGENLNRITSNNNLKFDNPETMILDSKKSNLRSKLVNMAKNSSSFLQIQEKEQSLMQLSASFRNHALYVSKLKNVKKNWDADVNPEFSQMSIKELNKFAGITHSSSPRARGPSGPKLSVRDDVSDFPKNFDWKNKLRSAGSQGNCGSCYAYSTLRMIEARIKITYGHDVKLSVQHALDCAIYNQGCDGGYPFLVMKFASEFDLIPEMCKPYFERNGKCNQNTCDTKLLPLLYRATNYHYVGGSYGQCSERRMMQELIEKGPIVVSFEPDYNFMMYKSGVYHSIDEKTWISKGIPKPEWEKVDHSVLLVGWGEEEKTHEKFWIIQNTWGPQWGENGFFRMRRGVDDFGIESICEAADPLIIEQATQRVLDKKDLENMNNNFNANGNNNSNKFGANGYSLNKNSVQGVNVKNNNNNSSNNNIKGNIMNNNNGNLPNSFLNDLNAIGSGFDLNVQYNNHNAPKNNNDNNNNNNVNINGYGRAQMQQEVYYDENKSIFDIFK